jgi:hypothetical protein
MSQDEPRFVLFDDPEEGGKFIVDMETNTKYYPIELELRDREDVPVDVDEYDEEHEKMIWEDFPILIDEDDIV